MRLHSRLARCFFVACFVALGLFTEPVASQVIVTVAGTVDSGTNGNPDSNPPGAGAVFGGAGDLSGDPFTLTMTFDPSEGTNSFASCSDGTINQSNNKGSDTSAAPTAVLQIGGGSYAFGTATLDSISWLIYRQAPTSCTSYNEVGFGWSERYGGTYSGSSGIGGASLYATSPNFTSGDWRTAIPATSIPVTDFQFNIALESIAQDNTKTLIAYAYGYLNATSVTVSGLEASNPVDKDLGACRKAPGQRFCGNPINLGNGNKYEEITDYATAGQNKLSFTRYYNSLGKSDFLSAGPGGTWRTTYSRTIQNSSATSVAVHRADGQVLPFTLNAGAWTTDTDVDVKLTQAGGIWTLTDTDDTVETYTTATANIGGLAVPYGQLASIQSRNGYKQTLEYGANNVLLSVTDSYNRTLTFANNAAGQLQTVTTPDGTTITYAYSPISPNLFSSVTYSTTPATSQTYLYENAAVPTALTGIIDENGNRFATWTYDGQGRGLSSQHAGGADLTTVSYDDTTGSRTVTTALGQQELYKFTTLQNVAKATEIDRLATATTAAATEKFTYDANGYVASRTDWNGNQTTYVNNTHGQPTTITDAAGSAVTRTTTISYHPTFIHLPHQIVTPGLTSTFVYDGSGNPLTRTDTDTTTTTVPYSTNGQTRVTTWTWSSTGEETSVRLPRTDVTAKTSFTYDSTGALTQVEDALGHLTKITAHTGGGLPETIVDPNNVTTTLAYDERLNLHTRTLNTTAGNLITTYSHDAANNLTAVELPDGATLTYGYDTAHRLTSTTDLYKNSIAYTLDALGDKTLVEAKDSQGTVTQKHTAVFDSLGRMTSDIGGMGQTTTYTYDNNGNAVTITPPSPSGTVSNAWDALNRLHTAKDPVPGGTTTYSYDAHDRVTSVEDANNNVTDYIYDGFGDRTQTASPDSGTTVYDYDGDRNVTQIVKPGPLTVDMTYDVLDRPLKTSYPADPTLNVSRAYDETGWGFQIGHLTSATDQVGSLSLIYDERGNVLEESRAVTGAGTLRTVMAFDAASRLEGIAYPSGTIVVYVHDSMGRVTSVVTQPAGVLGASLVATNITYEPFGPEASLSFGNGIAGTYAYDLDYRPTTRLEKGTSTIQNLSYGYYSNNSVKMITDAVNAGNTQTLVYDTLDRLTSATSGTGGYGAIGYTWDPVSNIETQAVNGTTTTYSLATKSNKLSQEVIGGTTDTIASTPAGNIATIKTGTTALDTFTYNQANELASAQTTSTYATYTYDLTGQRLEKALSGENPILYQFNPTGGELLAENDLHNGQTADYIYLNGRPIGEINPTTGALFFTHTDRLGTPQALTDSTQAIVWNATYQPFGSATFTGTLATQTLRLPGQQFDPETGLYHNGFRDYAPGLTRYVESDPIGLAGGMNAYGYVRQNPIQFFDFLGLTAQCPSNLSEIQAPMCYPNGASEGFVPYGSQYFADQYHLGGTSFLEYRSDTASAVNDPVAECVYDPTGGIVDDGHPYRMAQGTPDQYPVYGPSTWGNIYNHWLNDSGGPHGVLSSGQTLGDAAAQETQRFYGDMQANPAAVYTTLLMYQMGLLQQPQMSPIPMDSHTSEHSGCSCGH